MKILIAKPGLDGHDKGAKVITQALLDDGYEVYYSGLHRSINQIYDMIKQYGVDVLGMSILSGAHMNISRKMLSKLRQEGCNIPVFVGGIIPPKDIEGLKKMGIVDVFPAGSTIAQTIDCMHTLEKQMQMEEKEERNLLCG